MRFRTTRVDRGRAVRCGAWTGSVAAVQRCSLDGGSSTLYFAATGAINVATDGDHVYWISGQTGVIEPVCRGDVRRGKTLPTPENVAGFVPFCGYAYWTSLGVGRVPLPY
jgi:hypothetical protein